MSDDKERVLFFEIDGATVVVRDCHDIDEIELTKVGFTYCPVCGGKRFWEHGSSYLNHDPAYDIGKIS